MKLGERPERKQRDATPSVRLTSEVKVSALSVWWITLGIGLDRSRPDCPQDSGAHERMYMDLKREVQAVATERVEWSGRRTSKPGGTSSTTSNRMRA